MSLYFQVLLMDLSWLIENYVICLTVDGTTMLDTYLPRDQAL